MNDEQPARLFRDYTPRSSSPAAIPDGVDAVQFDVSAYDAIRFWISGDPRDIKDICMQGDQLTVEFSARHKRNLSLIAGDWLCRSRNGYFAWTGTAQGRHSTHAWRTLVISELTTSYQLSSPSLAGQHHAVAARTQDDELVVLILPAHIQLTSTPPPASKLGDGA